MVAHDLAGGGMTRAYALAQALELAGYDVEIAGLKLTDSSIYPAPPPGIKVTEIIGHGFFTRLVKLIRCLDGDIIYAIKPRPSSYGIALLNRILTQRPVILDIDDYELGFMEENSDKPSLSIRTRNCGSLQLLRALKSRLHRYFNYRRWLNPADKRYIKWLGGMIVNADAITVNTRFLHKRYGGTYLPHCKDTQKFNPDMYDPQHSRKLYGLSDYIVLMFPGTPRAHKGLEDILVAIETLNNPDIRLVLVGGRPCSDRYVEKLLQGWGQWIIRLPGFPSEKMPEVVAAAHAIVIPQRRTIVACAQAPMKLTDAMAMAKPVISTTVGDIPETLNNTGLLVDPSSPEQLVVALKQFLQAPDEAEILGQKARERFVRCYSLGVAAQTLSGVIEPLVPATGIVRE